MRSLTPRPSFSCLVESQRIHPARVAAFTDFVAQYNACEQVSAQSAMVYRKDHPIGEGLNFRIYRFFRSDIDKLSRMMAATGI
jgi:hypothetical protein